MENEANPKSLKFLTIALTIAAIISGWLAGSSIDRYFVQFPAFMHINIINWAEYSRHADLVNGLYLYPPEAIIPFLLLLISCIIILMNKQLNSLRLPVLLALLLSATGLFFTIFAAPVMLSVRNMPNDPVLLQEAFDKFHYWSGFRGIVQVLAFFPALWAMVRAYRMK